MLLWETNDKGEAIKVSLITQLLGTIPIRSWNRYGWKKHK